MNAFPAHAFFLLFQGKEMLIAQSEVYRDHWEPPRGVVGGDPRCEDVELILKEKLFREIIIESIERIDDQNSHFYLCKISGTAKTLKVGSVYSVRKSNLANLPPLTELAQTALSHPVIQNRLS